jgi:phytoene dehydrogenase-like protein
MSEAASRRLQLQNSQLEMGKLRNARSLFWRSPACSTIRAPRLETDMLPRIENQIEHFAPGFRDCILARRVFTPADLEKMNANLVGGDIGGGATDIRQFLFRPTWRTYATSASNVYICSSSTPPGAGVHGMCGYHAAKMALARGI